MRTPVLVATSLLWLLGLWWAGVSAAPQVAQAPTPQVAAPPGVGPAAGTAAAPVARQSTPPRVTAVEARATLDRYCVTCHNGRLNTAGLNLQARDVAHPEAERDVWEKVVRKVHAGQMPPGNAARPDSATAEGLVTYLRTTLDAEARRNPYPGRPLLQRLNRAEYANAIRDLLDLEVDVSALLPADNSGYGFDNVTDVLGVSPALLDSYLRAAEKITALALGDARAQPDSLIFRVRQDASQDEHIEGTPLGTIGGLAVKVTLPADGQYVLEPKLFRTNLGTMRGLENRQRLEIAIDGAPVHLAEFGGNEEVKASNDNPTVTGDKVDERIKVRVPITAGPHTITVAFLERSHVRNSWRLQRFERSSSDTIDFGGYPHVDTFTVAGPYAVTGVSTTPSRTRVLTCQPASTAEELPCARRILASLSRLAYRGQGTAGDVDALVDFYRRGRADGGNFEQGIGLAMRRMLSSPLFTFRAERDPQGTDLIYRVSDLELASRLSFFLWSSIPDGDLLDAARAGRLRTRAGLERQVRRMLADPRATSALINNFVGQYFYLRNLNGVQPNSTVFPDFDDNLRQAFKRETELLFETLVRENRPVTEILTADYTFVNERLARHYGMAGIYGDGFQRVTLTDETRRGILGHGSFLMVTSSPTRTSPVKRGKWILENVLGAPPPPPPPSVPPLPERGTASSQPLSGRGAHASQATSRKWARRSTPRASWPMGRRWMGSRGSARRSFDGRTTSSRPSPRSS
jgi:Protein of unknown function (DUF1592)/Protein of unknown function (DUF1587)/Protein of unknown function (DUF1588)/Protein of unknown function (DUF1595)